MIGVTYCYTLGSPQFRVSRRSSSDTCLSKVEYFVGASEQSDCKNWEGMMFMIEHLANITGRSFMEHPH